MEKCPKCDGTGWKIVQKSGLEGATRCECSAITRTRALKDSSRIPPNYRDASLENFVLPRDNPVALQGLSDALLKAKGFLRAFPAVEPRGLLFVGNPGTGKTHLAIGVMKVLLDRGHECLFFDYQNLLDRIRSGYDSASGAADREAYRSALDAEVLVLDDLGAHRVTEWVEDTVTAIITYRCNHKKPLIATTNLPLPASADAPEKPTSHSGKQIFTGKTLGEAISLRATSRLFEMCTVVNMPIVTDYREQMGRGRAR